MPKCKTNVSPFIYDKAEDYHEFEDIVKYFKLAGINLNYVEIDTDGYYYCAVFWAAEDKRPENLIEETKEAYLYYE